MLHWLSLVAAMVCLLVGSAKAHELSPAIADLSFEPAAFTIAIAVNLEVLVARIEPGAGDTNESANAADYDRLRALPAEKLAEEFDTFADDFLQGVAVTLDGAAQEVSVKSVTIPEVGDIELVRISQLIVTGPVPAEAKNLVWQWDAAFGPIVLRAPAIAGAVTEPYTAYLTGGSASDPIAIVGAEAQSVLETVKDYVWIGFTHIVPKGLDHILFVVGLFLLSTNMSPLLWQVTAFTVAHTVSLALGMLGIVTISPSIVEPLIALSIAYVAIENVFTSGLSRWRPFVVFGFGLLHGLGFAGVLTEIGLSSGQFVTGLISFNVGVELGQLTVILGCFLAVGLWFGAKSWYRQRITIPASLAIAAIGLYWFVERAFLA